jgi:hypothetical protein
LLCWTFFGASWELVRMIWRSSLISDRNFGSSNEMNHVSLLQLHLCTSLTWPTYLGVGNTVRDEDIWLVTKEWGPYSRYNPDCNRDPPRSMVGRWGQMVFKR